jgi:pimeloyl-ACP methyl ester carboxylesterase
VPTIIENPSFTFPRNELRAEVARMRSRPVPLARPVVVLAGWHSPGLGGFGAASILHRLTSGNAGDFLSIACPFRFSMRSAAAQACAELRRHLPNREVDIVGISMGGLVARAIMADMFEQSPVRVARLFTLATPHRGARLASWIRPDAAARDMQPGSNFLNQLDARLDPLAELHCYALLRDWWVGARGTAPNGHHPHWLDAPLGPRRIISHFAINRDHRILADVALRLRGEPPRSGEATMPPID